MPARRQPKATIADPVRGRWCAAALLVTRGGQYLMQHRDNVAWIEFPDHWCCFGGAIEPGETAIDALQRELREEIGLQVHSAEPFTDLQAVYPLPEPRLDRVTFFLVPVRENEIGTLTLREGAGLALLRPDELAGMTNVVPLDLTAILMHARRETLFRAAAARSPGSPEAP